LWVLPKIGNKLWVFQHEIVIYLNLWFNIIHNAVTGHTMSLVSAGQLLAVPGTI